MLTLKALYACSSAASGRWRCGRFRCGSPRIAAVSLAANERIGWIAALPGTRDGNFAPIRRAPDAPRPSWPFSLLHHGGRLHSPASGRDRHVPGRPVSRRSCSSAGLLWPSCSWGCFGLALDVRHDPREEGSDSFDALSRSYAYTFQRPLHYLFYAAVAGLFGWLERILVQNFAAAVISMTNWAASWAAGDVESDPPCKAGSAGGWLICFWIGCVKLLAVGFLFLLLRRPRRRSLSSAATSMPPKWTKSSSTPTKANNLTPCPASRPIRTECRR